MENSWNMVGLALVVTTLPLLLIVFIANKFSDQTIKRTRRPKNNRTTLESESSSTTMNNISPKLKPRLFILIACIIAFFFFGFKENGTVNYLGKNFEVGSVFSPESYTSYGLFKDAENELNDLVAKKRHSSLTGVWISVVIGGIVGYSLWKEDEFKDLLIEWRKA